MTDWINFPNSISSQDFPSEYRFDGTDLLLRYDDDIVMRLHGLTDEHKEKVESATGIRLRILILGLVTEADYTTKFGRDPKLKPMFRNFLKDTVMNVIRNLSFKQIR